MALLSDRHPAHGQCGDHHNVAHCQPRLRHTMDSGTLRKYFRVRYSNSKYNPLLIVVYYQTCSLVHNGEAAMLLGI